LTAPSASAPLLSPLESASASDQRGPSPSDSHSNDDDQYVQYRIRWLVLAAHAALSISNAVLWIGFAPIQEISAGEVQSINNCAALPSRALQRRARAECVEWNRIIRWNGLS
jgi:hypothetical protein